MRLVSALLITCLCLAASPAARAAATPAISGTADEKAVAAADEAFYQASLARKGQAWREFADDGATLPAGTGKEAIGARYDAAYARPGFRLSWHPSYAKVVGDLGITSGRYESHVQDASGHDQKTHGTYVTVWRRQQDGGWRFVWDGGTEAQ